MSRLREIEAEEKLLELYKKYKATRSPKDYFAALIYDSLQTSDGQLYKPFLEDLESVVNEELDGSERRQEELKVINKAIDDLICYLEENRPSSKPSIWWSLSLNYLCERHLRIAFHYEIEHFFTNFRKRINEKFEELM